MRDTRHLFNDLIAAAPALAAVRDAHVAAHDEVLPHLLMADVLRWLAAAALVPARTTDVRATLDVLEGHLAGGRAGAQEVILLSFLEHLGVAADDHGERELRVRLGPGLRAALDEMEAADVARDPDSEVMQHFKWPDGWLPETKDDGNLEPPT
jgi:hypothetical protein